MNLLHSSNEYIKRGNCIYDTDDNKLQEDVRCEKGNGFCKTWYKNGNLCMEANFSNNQMDGYFKMFYEDGSPYIEELYDNGKLKGISKKWDKDGYIIGTVLPIKKSFAPKRKYVKRR